MTDTEGDTLILITPRDLKLGSNAVQRLVWKTNSLTAMRQHFGRQLWSSKKHAEAGVRLEVQPRICFGWRFSMAREYVECQQQSGRLTCDVRGQRDMFLFWHAENNCVSKGGEEQFGPECTSRGGRQVQLWQPRVARQGLSFLKRKKRSKNSLTFRMPMSSYGGEDMSKGLPYSRHPFGSGAMVGSFGSGATINGKVTDLAGSAASAFA